MFKPMTQLNYFFRLATERKLSGSDQLMYLHIFNKFNQAHWPETLRLNDAELKDLMRLYDSNGKPASIDTLRRSRQRLKAKGFIDFTSGNGYEPEYRLPCLYPADSPADSPTNTPTDSLTSSYIRTREDALDVKTLNDYANAPANANEVDDLMEYWVKAGGCKLNFLLISKLAALAKEYGVEPLKKAIDAANSGANNPQYGFSLDYVKTKLTEGGKKIGKTDRAVADKAPTRIEYTEPEYTLEDFKKLFRINTAEEYEQAGLGSADEFRKRFKLG